jgi:hypothetical protein
MSDSLTREQVERTLNLIVDHSLRCWKSSDEVQMILDHDAALRAQLAQVTVELKKHLSGDYSNDPVDGIRQLAQAMVSNRGNCQTLEQQLADVTREFDEFRLLEQLATKHLLDQLAERDAKLEEAKHWADKYDVMGAEADELEFQRRGREIKQLQARITELSEELNELRKAP